MSNRSGLITNGYMNYVEWLIDILPAISISRLESILSFKSMNYIPDIQETSYGISSTHCRYAYHLFNARYMPLASVIADLIGKNESDLADKVAALLVAITESSYKEPMVLFEDIHFLTEEARNEPAQRAELHENSRVISSMLSKRICTHPSG